MTDEKIARINALAKKSRTPEGLTAEAVSYTHLTLPTKLEV